MATLATVTVTAVMDIIAVMATAAGIGDDHLLVHRPLVAGVAIVSALLVRPVQFEVGLVVIEVPSLPVARVVASLALRSKAALVDLVIFLVMARPAIRFRILERWRRVTLFTLYQHMTS